FLQQWSLVDSTLTKLRQSGAIGIFLASLILSRTFLIALVLTAIGLAWAAVWPTEDSSSALPSRAASNSRAVVGVAMQTANPHIETHIHLPIPNGPTATPVSVPGSEPPKQEVSHTLQLVQVRPIHLEKNMADRFFSLPDGPTNGAIAEFRNPPRPLGQRTPNINSVTAHMYFVGTQISEPAHISHGAWIDRIPHYAFFGSGQTHKLVIAVKGFIRRGTILPFQAIENPCSYEPAYRADTPPLKHIELPDQKSGRLEITLTDMDGVTVYEGTFDYNCADGTFNVNEKARPR